MKWTFGQLHLTHSDYEGTCNEEELVGPAATEVP